MGGSVPHIPRGSAHDLMYYKQSFMFTKEISMNL